MKIIDFEKKGNAVRFYLGEDDLKEWHGDDWDDVPYDCNAGKVYNEYISGYADAFFGVDLTALEPSDDYSYTNCPWSKNSMINGEVPCIIVTDDIYADGNFLRYCGSKNVVKFYFGYYLDPGIYIYKNGNLFKIDLDYEIFENMKFLESGGKSVKN